MNARLVVLCLLACAGWWMVPPARAASDTKEPHACTLYSGQLLAAMASGDYTAARAHFSTRMQVGLSAGALGEAWTREQVAAGPYRGHGDVVTMRTSTGVVVFTPLKFAKSPRILDVSCSGQGDIDGIHILSPEEADAIVAELKSSAAAATRAPVTAHTEADGVRIEPLIVPTPVGPLRGVLTLPAGTGPFPAVVLVSGSGPNDMDETVEGNKPFKDIAEGLARAGIASLRYDKRTLDYASKAAGNPGFTIDDEVTDDALTALHLLAQQKQVDPWRVFVLGHSLGAQMAPRIAQRDPELAGIILLAAPARSFLTMVAAQLRELGPKQGMSHAELGRLEQAIAAEQKLLAGANPAHPPKGSFAPIPGRPALSQVYLLSLHDVHQVAVAETLTLPMLILQGGSDFQVSPTLDFDAWKHALAGKPNVTFHLFPSLSHLFMSGPMRSPADYAKRAHVDPAVIDTVASWIKAQAPAK